jgi:hypothetical protein
MIPEKLPSDDKLLRIHNLWLGFKGWTTPWRARFAAYFPVGATVVVLCLLVEERLGIRSRLEFVAILAFCTWRITTKLMKYVTYDVGVRANLVIFWHEITAPRLPKPVRATLSVGHVKVKRLAVR